MKNTDCIFLRRLLPAEVISTAHAERRVFQRVRSSGRLCENSLPSFARADMMSLSS
jgi:hypothetical protein